MLDAFISEHRQEILDDIREVLRKRYPDRGDDDLMRGVPDALDGMVVGIGREDAAIPEHLEEAHDHGVMRREQGFDLSRLIHDYGLLCDTISETLRRHRTGVDPRQFQLLNRCIDECIATAVDAYAGTLIPEDRRETLEMIDLLCEEMGSALGTASIAFGVVRDGHVGVNSKTADIVERALGRAAMILAQLSSHAHLEGSAIVAQRTRVGFREVLKGVNNALSLEGGIDLNLEVAVDVTLDADPRLLTAAIAALVQACVRLCSPKVPVRLHAEAVQGAVSIEIQCPSNLSTERAVELRQILERTLRPQGQDVALAFAHRAIEAHGGTLALRTPGHKGFSFIISIPRTTYILDEDTKH